MCYHAEFGRSALTSIGIKIQENPQNWDPWNSDLLGMADPKIHAPPHMCYHVKFGSSATKGVRINRKEAIKWGALGLGRGWPFKTSSLPTCVATSNLVVLRQTVYA